MANILKKWVESDARELKRLGKKADKIEALKEEMEQLALENDVVKSEIEGKDIKKVIAVPQKLVNIVAK